MKIAVWPDGTWCDMYEVNQMTHLSDDYAVYSVDSVDAAERIAEAACRCADGRCGV